jgi:hypothetical protein
MDDRETVLTQYAEAEMDFDDLVKSFGDRVGWYAIVLWEPNGANAIWITGPYMTQQRAQVDCDYFSSGDRYGPIRRTATNGTDIPT